MKKDVLFIRSFTPDFDGRFHKFRIALEKHNINWHFLGWDRSGKGESKYKDYCTFFSRKGLIGGGIKNIYNLLLWNIYLSWYLIKNKKSIGVVQISDFDSALLGWPIAKILGKKLFLIFMINILVLGVFLKFCLKLLMPWKKSISVNQIIHLLLMHLDLNSMVYNLKKILKY
ncbi:hypothetical protein B9T11_04225 [Wohlfahrtiimonas chitiniclastica]|nr:hypothetical protein B9T11_04225 [Wohlfahrtiimonas chitiniclastica]